MMFSAKELKNHVIYTYTSVSIENVCTSGEMALPARWGLLSRRILLSLSLQGVKPQPVRLKTKSRWWLERSPSCPPSHSCQL